MSTEGGEPRPGPLDLGAYVALLVDALDRGDPTAGDRLRRVVGRRRARLGLDDEVVEVAFDPGGRLLIEEPREGPIDGEGVTDRTTVVDLLDGYLEVTDALIDGRIRVTGEADDVVRMFQAIEILLHASPRLPELQSLAARFRVDPGREPPGRAVPTSKVRRTSWFPAPAPEAEGEMLSRLGLLPDGGGEAEV